MDIDLKKYTKCKTTKNYELYLEKDPVFSGQRQILVHYLAYKDRWMLATLTDSLFKLFFTPEEYKQIYTQKER